VTDETDDRTEYLFQEAIRHLKEAREGDLRATDAVAVETVSNTVSAVLHERSDEE
jgi:hypothetical protein